MFGKDIYSNFGYYQVLAPQDLTGAAAFTGDDIDIQDFEAVMFVVNVGAITSAGAIAATDAHQFIIQHGLASADGVSTYSDVVYGSQLLHSVVSGAQTLTSGIWQSVGSYTAASTVYAIGYKKDHDHRYVRLVFSYISTPSVMSVGAIAICGWPNNWPINDAV